VPELPDVTLYVERLVALVQGHVLERVRVASPFVVRSFDPPIKQAEGKRVVSVSRIGKRIVLGLREDLFLVIHLMIAGRLRWKDRGSAVPKKVGLAAFDFDSGTIVFTEASSKKRASIFLVRGRASLEQFDRGGIEPLQASLEEFRAALVKENRTLKRALTDPRLIGGIGNAYSDEILFAAQLSPVKRTHQLEDEEIARLYQATRSTLTDFTDRLRHEIGDGFPDKVTAFRDDMAVHGRYKQPCRVCGTPVQRIRYAENEVNYCARCQTGGKLLADRALSRLLGADWPRSIEELDERLGKGQ
jgi:formamidopyrimidine-DNA glycosylase